MTDPAERVDSFFDWCETHMRKLTWAFVAGFILGLVATCSVRAEEPPVYKVLFACPNGLTVGVQTTSAELIIAYILTLTGRLDPQGFIQVAKTAFPVETNPDQPRLISEFLRGCLSMEIS